MTEFLTILPIMLALLLAKGFFSGSEIALVSCDKLKLQSRAERGDKRAKLVLKLFEKPESTLATTLIGTNISTMSLTVLGTATMIDTFGTGGELYAVLMLTPIMLIFGEIVPKSVYQQHADFIAPRVATLLSIMRTLLMPLTFGFGWIGKRIASLVGPPVTQPNAFVTRQRLRVLLDSADRAAELPVLDRDRIQRAVRLSDMTVGEAMVPLASVSGAPKKSSMKKLQSLSKLSGHRRVPLYEENISDITAIASWTVWDELGDDFLKKKSQEFIVTPHFASPVQALDELMPVLLSRTDHMAVVVDEFGSAIGIVTLQDLMLILLGDAARGVHLGPHNWTEPAHISRVEGEAVIVDAQTRLAEIAELLDVALPFQEYHTVSGFMTGHLKRIPVIDDAVDLLGYRFTVVEASSKVPLKIKVEPVSTSS